MASAKMSYFDLVKACDNFPYDEKQSASLFTLRLPHDKRPHGYILPSVVEKMPWTSDFQISSEDRTVELLDGSGGLHTSAVCNAAFAKVVSTAIEHDLFDVIHGQHSEMFRVLGANYPVQIERFASSLFGINHRGAHATMYTRTSTGMKIWVPRRSAKVFTYPGMLDTTVAGGVKADESPFETIVHEADEEASLPADLVRKDVRAVGVLTYMSESGEGSAGESGLTSPDVVYVYDLEVGEDVVPKPRDEEVKEFYLWGVEEVQRALKQGEFKTNSAVVMIDFFIRHGIITAENEADYVEIVMRMHRKLPFPTAPNAV